MNRFAKTLRDGGRSARTIQGYLTAIKGFTKWLAENNKLPRDPLASVRKPNPKSDHRYERRMLLPEEWVWLRKSLAGVRAGMPPAERALLYETEIQTGLWSSELRSLTKARLFLAAERPYVVCKAGSTKNALRRAAVRQRPARRGPRRTRQELGGKGPGIRNAI